MAFDQHTYRMVKNSKHRSEIIKLLAKSSPKTPKEIAQETAVAINNVSNYLSTLRKLGVVCCLTDELRKGRAYTLTAKGREIYGAMISNVPVKVS